MLQVLASIAVLLPLSVVALAPPGPWDKFNFAPTSKVVFPSAIHGVDGNVENAGRIVGGSGSATLVGSSALTLDFGVEVRSCFNYLDAMVLVNAWLHLCRSAA